MTESFYDLLGVGTDADADEIQQAYRQRIKETHPDVNDDPDASERTARIVEARDVLTDEAERARYDRLGHEAYVGDSGDDTADANPWTTGAAADAARSGTDSDGPTNARASAEERRRRERRARADVDFGEGESKRSRTAGDGGTATAGTAGTGGTAATGASGGTTAHGSGAGSRRGSAAASATRGPPPWNDTSQGWAARSPASPSPGLATQMVTAVRQSPATAVVMFLLYPLLVLGTFLPAFPLFVNVVVAACLLATIGAAQSVAGLGVVIFGIWSVLGAAGLVAINVSPLEPLGLVVLGTTWLPLGLSLLTSRVLDS